MWNMPFDNNRALMEANTPAMRYDGSMPFAKWQAAAREKLGELLGLPLTACQPTLTIEREESFDAFDEIRFRFQSEPGYFVPCHLWTPKGAKGPLPVVICLQGHSTGMHITLGRPKYARDVELIEGGDRDFAVRAVQEGYCALAIEQRCFGECGGTEKGPDCTNSAMTALLIGRTTVGERVWDVQRAIDVLIHHFPQADCGRIVCMGNSGGGTAVFYAVCMDERIAFAMPSCSFCTYDDSIAAMEHCACNYIPRVRLYFDMGDLAGLIAPRPLVIVSGREDDIFPHHGVEKAYGVAKAQYAAAGARDKLRWVIGEGGHRFYADDAWPVMRALIEAASND